MWANTKLYSLYFLTVLTMLFLVGCGEAQSQGRNKVKARVPALIQLDEGDIFDPKIHLWPHSVSDLKSDPNLIYGQLENGLRYVILPVADQQDRVSMRLQFGVGAFNEKPSQYGVAHFVEHMAFRGFKNPKTQELVKPLQRMGLNFGAGVNAFTSYETTIYHLDFPTSDAKNMNTGLTLLNEIARGLLMDADAFETERGVIIAENEARDTPQVRALLSWKVFQFPDIARYKSPVGGTRKTIEALSIENLRQFYTAHYRPDNALIVISGDVNISSIERNIRRKFANWQSPSAGYSELERKKTVPPPTSSSASPSVPPKEYDVAFKNYHEGNLSSQLNIVAVLPNSQKVDSEVYQKQLFLRKISMEMLNQRYRVQTAKSKIITWVRMTYRTKHERDIAYFSVGASNYTKAMAFVDTERRRAVEHGFSASELERALQRSRRTLLDRALASDKINAPSKAYAISNAFNNGTVLQSEQQKLEQFDDFAESFHLDDYHKEFSNMWSHYQPRFWLQYSKEYSKQEELFFKALKKAREGELKPYREAPVIAFKLPGVTPPGKIRSHSKLKKFDVERVVYENGLKLNYRKTDFKTNQVSVKINLGIGYRELAETNIDLLTLIKSLNTADHKNYTREQLSRYFEGKKTSFSISVHDDRLLLYNNNLSEADLQAFFENMTSFLLDVDFKSKFYAKNAILKSGSSMRRYNTTPYLKSRVHMSRALYKGDERFPWPHKLSVPKKLKKQLQTIASPYFQNGPIEIGISGDFDEEHLLKIISQTLAAMPKRDEQFTAFSGDVDALEFTDMQIIEQNYYGKDDKAAFHYCWPINRPYFEQDYERLGLIRRMLLLKITEAAREELGKIYIPDTFLQFSALYDNYGYICGGAQVNVDDLLAVEDVVKTAGQDLFEGRISNDEFVRAKNPFLAFLENQENNNSYISYQLAYAQSRPEKTTLFYGRIDRLKKLKLGSLKEITRDVFDPEKSVLVRTLNPRHSDGIEFEALLRAANSGDLKSQEQLANAYEVGLNVERNLKKSIKWHKKAAKNKSATSHYFLSRAYEKGDILAAERTQQIFHLRSASELGYKTAQYDLANIYARSLTEFPDVENIEIINLFASSAEQGYVPAQRELARQYVQGSMVERDLQEGMVWYIIADKTSHAFKDSKRLQELRESVPAEQQKSAQIKADKWLEKHNVRTYFLSDK